MLGTIELAAVGAKVATMFGVGTYVNAACEMLTPANLSEARKLCCGVAKFALSGAVTAAAFKAIDSEAEMLDKNIKDIRSKMEEYEKKAVKVKTKSEDEIEIEVKVEEPEKKETKKTNKKNTKKKETVNKSEETDKESSEA